MSDERHRKAEAMPDDPRRRRELRNQLPNHGPTDREALPDDLERDIGQDGVTPSPAPERGS